MNQKLIDYSRVISVMAQQDVLGDDVASQFCKAILPQLLAELDVMTRLADVRIAAAIDIPPAPEPKACEATVCSSRWATNQEKPAPQKAKKARKKPRARKPQNERADT